MRIETVDLLLNWNCGWNPMLDTLPKKKHNNITHAEPQIQCWRTHVFFKYTHPTSRPITTNIKVRHLFILDRILCQRIKFKITHALYTSPNLFNETIGFFSIVILIEINTQMKCYKVGFMLKISPEFPLWTWNRSRHMVILFIVIFAFTYITKLHALFWWIFYEYFDGDYHW